MQLIKKAKAVFLKTGFVFALLMQAYFAGAQDKVARLSVLGDEGIKLADVSVQVFLKDQAFFNGLTDSAGVLQIPYKQPGDYAILLNYLGYSDWNKAYRFPDKDTSIVVQMEVDPEWLGLVTVTGDRKLLTREPGRLVRNVEGSNALGNNALEILKNAPGVLVDNDNISFLSKAATIYLDGKPTKFSLQQLMNILAKKGAYSIKRIELIANPDAAFDASFDGRVINIVTKRRDGNGYTVGLSAEGIQRSTFGSWSTGVDLYARAGDLSIYGNAGYYDDKRREVAETERFFGSDTPETTINENERLNSFSKGADYSLGADYYLKEKTILGLKFSGYTNRSDLSMNGLAGVLNQGNQDSVIQLTDQTIDRGNLSTLNLNFKTDIDTSNSYLNFDVDYDWVESDLGNDQILDTYLNPDLNQLINQSLRSQNVFSSNRLFGIKADVKKYFKKATLDAGIKYADSAIRQDLDQFLGEDSGDIQIFDTLHYDEKILATYASINTKTKYFSLTAGLRAELTDYKGQALDISTRVADTYLNLFPSISLSKTFSEKNYVSLSYARKITRPRFQQIIPFRRYVSAFYYYIGNPALQPFFPHSVEAYYAYNNQFYLNLSYSQANKRILEFSRLVSPGSNITEGVKENNGGYVAYNASVGYNGKLQPWLFLNSGVTYSTGEQSFIFEGTREIFRYNAYSIYVSPAFDIREGLKANLNFYYNSDIFYGVSENLSYWYLGGGVSQDFLKGAAQVSFTFRDLFLTGITRRRSQYGDVNFNVERNWDSRQFILRLDYYFEAEGVKALRRRSRTANDDVRNRLGN
ncbi:MAG: outer membrane beta-barrel protein [Saprospiraceae bacterium]|nr:outer membrane beta-barrel protein [Saprospiraceae bacterium]